ncbi:colicin immunity domain-containing protein [Cupriavidus basilensis]
MRKPIWNCGKIERDSDFLRLDPHPLNECLSSVFCAADMYNSGDSRGSMSLTMRCLSPKSPT